MIQGSGWLAALPVKWPLHQLSRHYQMRGLYLAYHALDPAQYEHAVERGLELGYVAMDGRSGALN